MKYNDNGLWKTLNVKVTDTLPVGTIIPYAGTTIPSNYMKCEGQELSRVEYDILFSAIGTTYGVGDGTTTFNLPNLKGRVITGLDHTDASFDTLGEKGGEKTHTLTVEEMPSHNHIFNTRMGSVSNLPEGSQGAYMLAGENDDIIANTGGDQPHNNLQPYIVLNYVIKVLDAPATGVRSETLPVGTVIDYEGDTIPVGWEEITNPDSYSTNEVKTNKVWIDGKPIYRKVLTGSLPIGSGENVFTISNAKIINFNGIIKSTYNQWWPIPAIYSDDNYRIYTYISLDRTQLKVDCGSYFSTNSQYEIIIEYTKTTD